MAYVKTQDGQIQNFPYTIGDLRRDNPNTSFPRIVPEAILNSYGVYEVVVDDAPEVDSKNYKAVRSLEPTLVNGSWALQWSVIEKTTDEKQSYSDAVASKMRAKRDTLLRETDHCGLSDMTMTAAMATYRQALRDITDQVAFPHLSEADWPTKPE